MGDGGYSVVISATAEQIINRDVPAGSELALKMMKQGWPARHLKNTSLGREGISSVLLESRLLQQEFSDFLPMSVYVLPGIKNGRSFRGCT